ncbi:MAG: GNAT family N-acetyltransferase [Acidimicrobiia bacterium]|nr:GNAT family N-acetyltransferase [Acidimicrobiia bacterium]
MGKLRLRPLRDDDEAAFAAAQRTMAAEGFPFGFDFDDTTVWAAYVERLDQHRCGSNLAPGRVPATYLVADVDGTIVGRASIRHELNDFLAREGGHIGYCVLPPYRGRGYATEILRQSLVIARSVGVDDALLVCDADNLASATVIDRCGGLLADRTTDSGGTLIRRYWIS